MLNGYRGSGWDGESSGDGWWWRICNTNIQLTLEQTGGIKSANPQHSQKSTYNYPKPEALTRSLTDNTESQLTHIFHVVCDIYAIFLQ